MKKLTILFVSILAMTGIALSGCVSKRVDLVDTGAVSLQRLPSKDTHISRVDVFQDGDELVITGKLRRGLSSMPGLGHVDIAIVDPEGKILKEVHTNYFPRILARKQRRRILAMARNQRQQANFGVRLPLVPPPGSTIRVTYHN